MPLFEQNGIRLFYEVHGNPEAEPVLLLHGLGASREMWRLQVEAWRSRYFLIVPDLPGHGDSPPLRAPITIAEMADQVAALVRHLGVGPVHVVGLSMGGMVAQEFALRHPDLVRDLVLVNTFARLPRPRSLRDRLRLWWRSWLLRVAPMRVYARQVARRMFPKPEQAALRTQAAALIARNDRRSVAYAWRAILAFDTFDRLPTLRVPTLVIHGEEDTTVPYVLCQQLAQRIPNARLKTIANSGHATPIDSPNRFNQTVESFWRGEQPGVQLA
ncbi:MAG: alpha/beta fold hydrolase [Ardenticatenia bacterium]|nr:MAG: alpha/beta fold hydrolase [Ardenticatenia bacterium]